MPTVTKHTSNNLVTVAYQVRESVLDITHAEHTLILAESSSAHKVKMIKFIRGQYNLGLYDAKQVVDTVIEANEKLQTYNKYTQETVNRVDLEQTQDNSYVNWSEITRGTIIYVRDCESDTWVERRFIAFRPNNYYEFLCSGGVHMCTEPWKYAKLSND